MYPPGSKYFRSKSYIHARNRIVYSNFKLTKMYILINKYIDLYRPTQILQNVTNRYTANFLLVPFNNYIFKQFLFCSKHNYVCNL